MSMYANNARIGYQWRTVADPSSDIDAAARLTSGLDTGAKTPTTWMRRIAGTSRRVTTTPIGQVPMYEGRACCFDHLSRFEAAGSLQVGVQTACPECSKTFVLELTVKG